MRSLGKLVVAVGVLALVPTFARAQGPGFGMGGGPFVLAAPNVQKDLKLTDEQVDKVMPSVQEIFGNHRDELMGLRDLPAEERAPKARAIRKAMIDEAKKALALKPEQSKRLDQISLQQRGIEAFLDPDIAGKLQLTDDQKKQLQSLAEDMREKARDIFQNAGDDRAEAMRKIMALNKEVSGKVVALLTDDQKKTWKDMTGEPIEVQFPRRPNN